MQPLRAVSLIAGVVLMAAPSGLTSAAPPAGETADRTAAAGRPNIVFILADDYGINGVGCYGSDRFKGKTPNIDGLAGSGVRFEQCYSMPSCNPTRCALMTGRYGFRTGNKPSFRDEPSVARILKQAGYATGMAGKWRQMGDTPRDWGFDEYLTDPEAGGYYWETTYERNGDAVKTEKPFYFPDVCSEFAVDFFRRHREQPFFFYYPTHLIHNPILNTPDSKADAKDLDALYEDNVAYLDKEVGRLVAALEKLGLSERTLIVFAGDNGTAKYGHEKGTIGGRPVHGMKGTLLEGGSRVPLIARWKETIPQRRVVKDLVDVTDFLPTFAELGGVSIHNSVAPQDVTPQDAKRDGVTLDGRSFAPQLRGEHGNPREWVYVEHNTNPEWYVREQGWKLTHQGELFDMSDAPFVEKPMAVDGQSDAAAAARQRLQAVLAKLDPASGKHVDPADRPKKKPKKKKKPSAGVSSVNSPSSSYVMTFATATPNHD